MNFNQKFEPKDNQIIHGAGQSFDQFKKYWMVTKSHRPLVYMAYNKVGEIEEK
ncbi:MAG: hypothetical protein WC595_02830 [Candidatus Nanoarchaeia archaeon]